MRNLIHSLSTLPRSIMLFALTRRATSGSYVMDSSKRRFTQDEAALPRTRYYTTERLGSKQALTPEGFLIVHDVPIARTGEMVYGPGEVPLEAGPDGIIHVTRDESEVFRPEFILSFAGKPVVNDHPSDEVNSRNWRQLAMGTVMYPRRGEDTMRDLLIADLIIHDQQAIADVQAGKREVSCGYDADYVPEGVGRGRQVNMVGNHVALVDSGRCGPRCAIGDQNTRSSTGDCSMKTKPSWLDSALAKVRGAFETKNQKVLDEAINEIEEKAAKDAEGGEALHLHLGNQGSGQQDMSAYDERLGALEEGMRGFGDALEEIRAGLPKKEGEEPTPDAEATEQLEGELAEEAPAGTGDAARKAKDSAYLADSFQQTVALAEVLVPGMQVMTYDRAAAPGKTFDAICKMRRTALDLAYTTPDGRAAIDTVLAGRKLSADMKCRDVRTIFVAAAAVRKASNNKPAPTADIRGVGGDKTGPMTPAKMNARNAEFYKQS